MHIRKLCAVFALLAHVPVFAANHTVFVGENSLGQAALSFNPSTLTIAAGDTITFMNRMTGGLSHNAVSDDGGATFSSGALAGGPWTFTTGPINASIAYHCALHGTAGPGGGTPGTGMAASITVTVPVRLQSFDVK